MRVVFGAVFVFFAALLVGGVYLTNYPERFIKTAEAISNKQVLSVDCDSKLVVMAVGQYHYTPRAGTETVDYTGKDGSTVTMVFDHQDGELYEFTPGRQRVDFAQTPYSFRQVFFEGRQALKSCSAPNN